MTLAATLASDDIAATISSGTPGVFMHGPTFMANPLACSVALASINLLLDSQWQEQLRAMALQLRSELEPAACLPGVNDVRILGGIGVIEMKAPVNVAALQQLFVEHGVWIRPFGNLIYIMPPYVIEPDDLSRLTAAMVQGARTAA